MISVSCVRHSESVDHISLHCPLMLGLWYRLFRLTMMDWIPSSNISDMISISFKGDKTLGRPIIVANSLHCFNLSCIVRKKCKDFLGKAKT